MMTIGIRLWSFGDYTEFETVVFDPVKIILLKHVEPKSIANCAAPSVWHVKMSASQRATEASVQCAASLDQSSVQRAVGLDEPILHC